MALVLRIGKQLGGDRRVEKCQGLLQVAPPPPNARCNRHVRPGKHLPQLLELFAVNQLGVVKK